MKTYRIYSATTPIDLFILFTITSVSKTDNCSTLSASINIDGKIFEAQENVRFIGEDLGYYLSHRDIKDQLIERLKSLLVKKIIDRADEFNFKEKYFNDKLNNSVLDVSCEIRCDQLALVGIGSKMIFPLEEEPVFCDVHCYLETDNSNNQIKIEMIKNIFKYIVDNSKITWNIHCAENILDKDVYKKSREHKQSIKHIPVLFIGGIKDRILKFFKKAPLFKYEFSDNSFISRQTYKLNKVLIDGTLLYKVELE